MNYYPVRAILARDFRNLENVVIDFSQSPIISLIGENEAGKSSVAKAIKVIGSNADPNAQKDFIRTGKSGFLIAVCFADPETTYVVREKSATTNSYSVQKGDKIVWQVSKLDRDGPQVPPEIQKYMGFVLEPETKELLNVRTYEDLMIFIHTSNSANYKIMYNALKIDAFRRAMAAGQNQINADKKDIKDDETGISTLTDQLIKIKIVDLDPLMKIKSRLEAERDTVNEIDSAINNRDRLKSLNEQSKNAELLDKTDDIDEMLLYELKNAQTLKIKSGEIDKNLKAGVDIDKLQNIDMETINVMMTAKSLKDKLEKDKENIYSEIDNAKNVDIEPLIILESSKKEKDRLDNLNKEINEIDSSLSSMPDIDIDIIEELRKAIDLKNKISSFDPDLNSMNSEIDKLTELLKESGVQVATCPHCGATVIFGEEHIHG